MVLDAILSGGVQQERMVRQMYRQYFGLTKQALKQHRALQQEQAEDAYTDAVMTLRAHILNRQFRGDSEWSTYLNTIFQRRCIDAVRQTSTHKAKHMREQSELPMQMPARDPDIVARLSQQDDWKRLQDFFQKLGESCRQVLMDWGYYGYNMEEIAQRHNFKDANTVRSKKYTCMKQLNKLIQQATPAS